MRSVATDVKISLGAKPSRSVSKKQLSSYAEKLLRDDRKAKLVKEWRDEQRGRQFVLLEHSVKGRRLPVEWSFVLEERRLKTKPVAKSQVQRFPRTIRYPRLKSKIRRFPRLKKRKK